MDAEEETTRYIGGVQSREGARKGLEDVLAMWARRGCSLFSVFEKASGRWIGRTGPWVPDDALGTEIGWAFAAAAQGRGYATEAAGGAVGWANMRASPCPALKIELLEATDRNLEAPTQDRLFLLPLEGLRNIWYFYGGVGENLVAGDLIATV